LWGIGATFDSTPSELNFYFRINPSASGSPGSVTVYLAQGSVVSNNWWIGGDSIQAGQLKFFSSGNLMALDISGNSSNGFIFMPVMIRSRQNKKSVIFRPTNSGKSVRGTRLVSPTSLSSLIPSKSA
jgi:hypothetical protein